MHHLIKKYMQAEIKVYEKAFLLAIDWRFPTTPASKRNMCTTRHVNSS